MKGLRRIGLALVAGLLLCGAVPAAVAASEPDPRLTLVNLRVFGGEGWHADGEFQLNWDRPGGEAGLRAVAIAYLVRNAARKVVVDPVRVEDENPTGAVIQVPPLADEYMAELWLEGEEGEGPHSEARLRFDPHRPGPARPLVPTGWVRAGVPVTISLAPPTRPWPASGIRGYAIAVGGEEGPEPCADPERCRLEETDLAGGPDDNSLAIGPLPEGPSFVRAYAVSGAGMRSTQGETAVLHADGTEPAVAFDPVQAGWAREPVIVTARAWDRLSGMDPDGPSGARTAIEVDGLPTSLGPGETTSAVVAGEGIHTLLASARDAVGNPSVDAPPATAATAVVRIDETPPRVAFLPTRPTEPERIEALVTDSLAGLDPSRGSIAVRRKGSREPFTPVPTLVGTDRLLALWDSDSYPPGSYEFEAIAYDAAGNRAATGRRSDGSAMVLTNPVKATTSLAAGFGGRRGVVQTCNRRSGVIRCRRRPVPSYDKRPARRATRYGQGIAVGGRLSGASGSPLADQEVTIVETYDAGAELARRETTAVSAADGTFLFQLAAGPSRRIEVRFAGTPTLGRAASRSLRLAVRTPVRLRSSAASAIVGGAPIVFSGTVGHAGATLPKEGLPVALEFRIGPAPWSEFRTVQTDSQGRFRYPYAFADNDSRGVRFQFRAVLHRQPGWPYATGASLPISVTGR